MERLFIRNEDVCKLYGVKGSRATTIIQTIKDSLKKEKHQKITIYELAKYEGITPDEVIKHMK